MKDCESCIIISECDQHTGNCALLDAESTVALLFTAREGTVTLTRCLTALLKALLRMIFYVLDIESAGIIWHCGELGFTDGDILVIGEKRLNKSR